MTQAADNTLIQGDLQTIQNIMWRYVGLIRSGELLLRPIPELRHLLNEIETFYTANRLSDVLIGLRSAGSAAIGILPLLAQAISPLLWYQITVAKTVFS